MGKYIACVGFDKMCQHFNINNGASGDVWTVQDDKIFIEFDDTSDFKDKLAQWVTERFYVEVIDFNEYCEKQEDEDIFTYCQSEDEEGYKLELDENNQDGYLSDYTFYVMEVSKQVEYKF